MIRTVPACAILCALACSPHPPPSPARCVVLITCDTLRADRLGAYGYARPTSPRLDELAREATLFEHALASAPMTTPSLSSLLTGLYPRELGIEPGNTGVLPDVVETLAERCAAAGIRTAAVVSNWVLRKGPPGLERIGLVQGFRDYDDTMSARERNRAQYERVASDTTDAALRWLGSSGVAKSGRFFLWVHFQDPHGPYTPPPELEARFASEPSAPTLLSIGGTTHGVGQIPSYQALDGERRAEVYRDRYDAEIAYFDRELGRLLDGLRAAGAWDDALVLVTADHGESLGEHDTWFCHGENLHLEEVRVPLLVKFPSGSEPRWLGATARGARSDRLVGLIDVWPTVLAAFGLSHEGRRGVSLFDADPAMPRALVQSLAPDPGVPRSNAVSDGRFRLLWRDGQDARELYDALADPGELHDLARERPADVERLLALYREATSAPAAAAAPRRALDDDDQRALEKLGYAEGKTSK